MTYKYANVIINISHEEVDRPFSYRIPEALHGLIFVGSQVEVPFGAGSKTRTGFVVGFTNEVNFPEERIKDIVGISKKAVNVEGKLLALAAWIKEYYGSTMIDAIHTVLPARRSVANRVEKTVRLGKDVDVSATCEAYEKKHAVAKIRLLKALDVEGAISMEGVRNRLGVSTQTVNAMASEGVITVDEFVKERTLTNYDYNTAFDLELNAGQQKIVDEVEADIADGIRRTYLLHGITGSGKTEVYVKLIKAAIARGEQAIVLIPEISLTYQNVKYFRNYFGDRVTIINSRLSDGERYDQLMRAKNGDVDVVIGPRSALFAPFPNLGLIVIDEEHETSYKSDSSPKYHAREVALKRAELEGAAVILGSATPSVESYSRAKAGNYKLFELSKRAGKGALAQTEIVDLRQELRKGNRSIISKRLSEEIADRLEKKEQVMLFINKRGYNSFVSCRSCGEAIRCPHCDVTMTKHNYGKLICHYCDYRVEEPKECPNCKSNLIGGYGTGTQKVEEEVKKLFPSARVLRMDRDTTTTKNAHQEILSAFDKGEADILVGTQMIVKGHDFARVTLVGIMLADLTLFNNDYRAGERTFGLITQAAGRAGRGDLPGLVIIQTYKPENYAITNAAAQNYKDFFLAESAFRSLAKYPPEWNMMVMLVISKNEKVLETRMEELCGLLNNRILGDRDFSLIGPTSPVISKIRDIHRRVVYIKHFQYNPLIELKDLVEQYMTTMNITDVKVQFDFNPLNLY